MIKVCGVLNQSNVDALGNLPIDLLGINFYSDSSRFIGNRTILPSPNQKMVGVFVNPSLSFVLESAQKHNLTYVQLHGDETSQFCEEVRQYYKVIKAVGVETPMDIILASEYQNCDFILFDKKSKYYGGTGKKFNWKLLDAYQEATPFFVAGGIGPEDYKIINEFKHPCFQGIDINSKFETAPGLKDHMLISSFIHKLNNSIKIKIKTYDESTNI